jgi:Gpi18-like mannosyltransferase
MAIYACLIVKHFNNELKSYMKVFIYSLILPGVIINSAVLGQCDSIYTAFVLMFVYYILKNKIRLAMFLFGIALSFKLQAIFIAPIILYLLLTKKIKISDCIYAIIGFMTLMLPAIFHGKNLIDILMIYLNQTKEYSQIVRSAPNIYSFFGFNYVNISPLLKYLLSIIVIVISIYITIFNIKKYKKIYDSNQFINKVMLLSLFVPYLLPGMMDRYFYMANLFILINLFININSSKFEYKLFVAASIAYFIPVFSINFLLINDMIFRISEGICVNLISSTINTYVIYVYFKKYILLNK